MEEIQAASVERKSARQVGTERCFQVLGRPGRPRWTTPGQF